MSSNYRITLSLQKIFSQSYHYHIGVGFEHDHAYHISVAKVKISFSFNLKMIAVKVLNRSCAVGFLSPIDLFLKQHALFGFPQPQGYLFSSFTGSALWRSACLLFRDFPIFAPHSLFIAKIGPPPHSLKTRRCISLLHSLSLSLSLLLSHLSSFASAWLQRGRRTQLTAAFIGLLFLAA